MLMKHRFRRSVTTTPSRSWLRLGLVESYYGVRLISSDRNSAKRGITSGRPEARLTEQSL